MTRSARSSRLRDDRGSATAETAIVLPVVVVMVLLILVVGTGMSMQVRLESAARTAARELARGEDPAVAAAAAQRVAGDDARVSIAGDGAWVVVTVSRELRVADGPLAGGSWTLDADAAARLEPQLLGSPAEEGPPSTAPEGSA
ncbi:TadE family type IV pilus minor pilin [Brachybacterium sp. DNPG3]